MNETVTMIFGLAGGLAMFLYGMNSMSDALQKAAGEKMKKILGFLTKNPVMGALAGAVVTAVLQSSSATTVMVIGFVSAGLMSLPQAISVIFGANIGTTMTAQLLAFKISDYIYPIIFLGFILNFVSKKEKVKNVGLVIFSFGLLFEGIEIMGSVMKPLAGSPVFVDLMGRVAEVPVLGILLGAVMTLIVQSSSATIAVLQNFASQAGPDGVSSVIGLSGAIPILLGDNIGTTITALMASIGQSKNAKRTAVAHSVFNITGSMLFVFLIPWMADFVRFISPKGNEVDVISRQIANAHTTFNICCTLIWLPLIPLMVKIVMLIVRGEDNRQKEFFAPKYLDENMFSQPVVAMYLVSEEIGRLSDFAGLMMKHLRKSIAGKEPKASRKKYNKFYGTVTQLQESISTYITRLFARGSLTEQQSEQMVGLLAVSNSIDRIAGRCAEVTALMDSIQGDGKILSKDAVSGLEQCINIAEKLFQDAMDSVKTGNMEIARKVVKNKNKIRKIQKQLNKAHLSRVKKKNCDSALTADFSNILYSLRRMADSCIGIAEETLEDVSFVQLQDGIAVIGEKPASAEMPESGKGGDR